MLDQGNRTFIGSVVFVDIVGYSKRSVSEQISIKDRFTALLSDVLVDIPVEQRLILDTGDGAALSFLGDPEDALFVSMNMRDMVARAAGDAGESTLGNLEFDPDSPGRLPLRIGINLGPVKLVRDINGHPNIVGDGINVAQRIMSFARPGQIVVSRSFFDVVSVISDEYAKLFKYEGSRTDKHVREHEIYVVGDSVAAFEKARAGTVDRAAATNPRATPGVSSSTSGLKRPDVSATTQAMPFFRDRRKLGLAGGGLAVIVFALFVALLLKKPTEKTADTVAAAQNAVSQQGTNVSAVPPAISTSPPGETSSLTRSATAPNVGGSPLQAPVSAPAGTTLAPIATSPDPKAVAPKVDTAKPDAAKQVMVLGTVKFSIDPWGDVSVNGKSVGVSPPMKQTKLPPGKYTIEVRNTSFKPYVANIEVKTKEDVSIKHKFQ